MENIGTCSIGILTEDLPPVFIGICEGMSYKIGSCSIDISGNIICIIKQLWRVVDRNIMKTTLTPDEYPK